VTEGGGSDATQVVVSVGSRRITVGMVAHMMRVRGHIHAGLASVGLRSAALDELITAEWLLGEAATLGIAPTVNAVNAQLAREQETSFPTQQQFAAYLKASGQTLVDLRRLVASRLAEESLRTYIAKNTPGVTAGAVGEFYARHRKMFHMPEHRDIQAIRTWTKSQILAAKHEIEHGESFGKVAERISIDRPSNEHGGATKGIVPGQEERGFDQAIFSSRPHVLVGPLHLRKRYYIFEVTRIEPGHQEPLTHVRSKIERLLPQRSRVDALSSFIASWRIAWRAKTHCDVRYLTQKCANFPPSRRKAEDPVTFN
jgi:parvulin-like peptidyl-prolyl isomerase